jgi:hypothetical protein
MAITKNKLSPRQVKEAIRVKEMIEESKRIIAQERDRLEELHQEVNDIISSCGAAEESLQSAIEELSNYL